MPRGPYFKNPMQKTGSKNNFSFQNNKHFNFWPKNDHFSVRRQIYSSIQGYYFGKFSALHLLGSLTGFRKAPVHEKILFIAWKNLFALVKDGCLKTLLFGDKSFFEFLTSRSNSNMFEVFSRIFNHCTMKRTLFWSRNQQFYGY